MHVHTETHHFTDTHHHHYHKSSQDSVSSSSPVSTSTVPLHTHSVSHTQTQVFQTFIYVKHAPVAPVEHEFQCGGCKIDKKSEKHIEITGCIYDHGDMRRNVIGVHILFHINFWLFIC